MFLLRITGTNIGVKRNKTRQNKHQMRKLNRSRFWETVLNKIGETLEIVQIHNHVRRDCYYWATYEQRTLPADKCKKYKITPIPRKTFCKLKNSCGICRNDGNKVTDVIFRILFQDHFRNVIRLYFCHRSCLYLYFTLTICFSEKLLFYISNKELILRYFV